MIWSKKCEYCKKAPAVRSKYSNYYDRHISSLCADCAEEAIRVRPGYDDGFGNITWGNATYIPVERPEISARIDRAVDEAWERATW